MTVLWYLLGSVFQLFLKSIVFLRLNDIYGVYHWYHLSLVLCNQALSNVTDVNIFWCHLRVIFQSWYKLNNLYATWVVAYEKWYSCGNDSYYFVIYIIHVVSLNTEYPVHFRFFASHTYCCALAVGQCSLQWRHNEHDGVSYHQPHDCLLDHLTRADQGKHQSSASLAFVWGIHRWPVNSPHKEPVTRKMFPSDDYIMYLLNWIYLE